MNKYKCNKCGQESEMIPKEHGYFENVYSVGEPTIHKQMCSGKFVLVATGEGEER